MSEPRTLLLGLIAGGTILLGMPLGRLKAPRPALRQMLNALAIGVLIFLLWDVLSGAFEPIDTALGNVHDHTGGLAPVFGYGALFFGGLVVGLMSLVYYEGWIEQRQARARSVGAMAISDPSVAVRGLAGWSEPRRLALMIAVGIGVHNFGEGLAIGSSAASGEIALATVLVIGFALHNATEGFGIVAPLAAESEMPSWRFLLTLAAIGGGPTFLGTEVGYHITSEAMSVLFLTLAAGSILYVVVQLLGMAMRSVVRRDLIFWCILLGLAAGFITDMVVTAGGA
jgi:ZIP family zinc transporter